MQFDRLKRRDFITLLGGVAAAWPFDARAQQGERVRRVGVLMPYAESDPLAQIWFKAFVDGMQAVGWIDGGNVRLDIRWVGGVAADRMQRLATELVDLRPDVVFAMNTVAVKAVLRASRTVPIVFTQVTDPVAQGLVESLDKLGGSVTGITIFEPEIGTKLMQVLKEIRPRRRALLHSSEEFPQVTSISANGCDTHQTVALDIANP
jgi:putative ABC transport system substrate-binding protein